MSYKKILIAIDGSELSNKALEQGAGLAKGLGAEVIVVNVTEPYHQIATGEVLVSFPVADYDKAAATAAHQILDAAEEMLASKGVTCEKKHVKDQHPADGITGTAKKEGADLIVVASHGRRGISRLLLGSQANAVVVQSEIPVLVCR
ncbi:MAG: universal stress protein [Pseudomonadota bacterium]